MNQLPFKNPSVVFQRVADGAVLLSTTSEVYFGLDPVGALIWELLPPHIDAMDALCVALQERYPDVGASTLRADATEFLNGLVEAGLVRVRDGAG